MSVKLFLKKLGPRKYLGNINMQVGRRFSAGNRGRHSQKTQGIKSVVQKPGRVLRSNQGPTVSTIT